MVAATLPRVSSKELEGLPETSWQAGTSMGHCARRIGHAAVEGWNVPFFRFPGFRAHGFACKVSNPIRGTPGQTRRPAAPGSLPSMNDLGRSQGSFDVLTVQERLG